MQIFTLFPELQALISTKADGSCRITPATPEIDRGSSANRNRFLRSQGIDPGATAGMLAEHGGNVHIAGRSDAGRAVPRTDGLVTREKGLYLVLTVADCLPIYLYEPRAGITGLLHGGWRGLSAGIVPAGIKAVRDLGGSAADIAACIGPSIGPCHFEIKEDVAEKFKEYPAAPYRLVRGGGSIFLDLRAIAREMLVRSGVPATNVEISGECTACLPDKFFSYRRDKPEFVETMVAVIGRRY